MKAYNATIGSLEARLPPARCFKYLKILPQTSPGPTRGDDPASQGGRNRLTG